MWGGLFDYQRGDCDYNAELARFKNDPNLIAERIADMVAEAIFKDALAGMVYVLGGGCPSQNDNMFYKVTAQECANKCATNAGMGTSWKFYYWDPEGDGALGSSFIGDYCNYPWTGSGSGRMPTPILPGNGSTPLFAGNASA